jgi:hypothetical protein
MLFTGAPKFPGFPTPELSDSRSINELEEKLNMPIDTASGRKISWLRCFIDACRKIIWLENQFSIEESYNYPYCGRYAALISNVLESKGINALTVDGCNCFYFLPVEIRDIFTGIYNSTKIITPTEMIDLIKWNIKFDDNKVIVNNKQIITGDPEKVQECKLVLEMLQNDRLKELVGYYNIDFMAPGNISMNKSIFYSSFHTITIFKLPEAIERRNMGIVDTNADQFAYLTKIYDRLRTEIVPDFQPNPILEDKPRFFNYNEAIEHGLYLPFREEDFERLFKKEIERVDLVEVFETMQKILLGL